MGQRLGYLVPSKQLLLGHMAAGCSTGDFRGAASNASGVDLSGVWTVVLLAIANQGKAMVIERICARRLEPSTACPIGAWRTSTKRFSRTSADC